MGVSTSIKCKSVAQKRVPHCFSSTVKWSLFTLIPSSLLHDNSYHGEQLPHEPAKKTAHCCPVIALVKRWEGVWNVNKRNLGDAPIFFLKSLSGSSLGGQCVISVESRCDAGGYAECWPTWWSWLRFDGRPLLGKMLSTGLSLFINNLSPCLQCDKKFSVFLALAGLSGGYNDVFISSSINVHTFYVME
jgi:hypothetical protein